MTNAVGWRTLSVGDCQTIHAFSADSELDESLVCRLIRPDSCVWLGHIDGDEG